MRYNLKNRIIKHCRRVIVYSILITFFQGVYSCVSKPPEKEAVLTGQEYQWVKVVDSAPFRKSYNFQLFSIRDTLWAFHPGGNYFSTDGKSWQMSGLPNSISNLAFLDYVFFDSAMYGLGHFDGNIEQFSFLPRITKSRSLKNWDTLSSRANLPERFFYHPFVFKNKIWFIGGMNTNESFADAWNSSDAVLWNKVSDGLPFGKRSGSQVVFFRDRLFLLNNDVWSSADGIEWKQETKEILKGIEVFGYAAVVYDEKIWLLGCNRNGHFSSKVLYSADGKVWRESAAPWSPRGGVAACVHKGRIYLTGGKYGGMDINHPEFEYSNDVWFMEKIHVSAKSENPIAFK